MRMHALGVVVALAVVSGCSKGPDDTVTVLGYAVQVTTAPPATAVAGSAVPIAFSVIENESDGTSKPASGKSFTVAVTAGGGAVNGSTSTTLTTSSSGSVSFTWTLGPLVGVQTLRGSVSTSEFLDLSLTATAAPATQLAFVTTPSASATTGIILAQQPALQLKNASGGNVGQAGVVVTAAIGSGGGALGGVTTATTDANGVATFGNLVINGVAGPVTLTFSAPLNGATATLSSAAINVAAPQLVLATQPATNVVSGIVLSRQPTVQLKDGSGTVNLAFPNIAVTASIASGGGTLSGTTTVNTDANGLATFTNLLVTSPSGNVVLRFAATVNGQNVTVNAQPIAVVQPNQMTFASAPSATAYSTLPLFVEPVVQLNDGSGSPLAQAGVVVTVSKASGTPVLGLLAGGNGALTATTDANGRATFHDLVLTGTGAVTLQFTAPGMGAATTGINVTGLPTITQLANSVPVGSLAMNAGDIGYYTFQAPAGTLSLDIAAFQGLGNVELYLRRNLQPTTTDFDCAAAVAGPSQICTITTNVTAPYFIVLRAVGTVTGKSIRANAYNSACASKGALTLGVTTAGTLSLATACAVEQGQLINDRYTLTVPADQALSLTAGATVANPIFVAYRLPGNQFTYWAPFGSPAVTVSSPLLFGAGTYEILVGDNAASNATRGYTIKFAATSPNPVGCNTIAPASAPLTIAMTLSNNDCAGTTNGTFSHRAAIVLGYGQSVTVTMASTAFDPLVKTLSGITTGTAPVLATDDNGGGGTTARLTFTNTDPANSQFTIELTSKLASAVGAYTLTLNFSPAYYQAPTPLSGAPPALVRAPAGSGGP